MYSKLVPTVLAIALTSASLSAQINIPDPNFKAYLVGESTINTNGDSEIQYGEATAFNGAMNAANLGIEDLTGIEFFTSLRFLYCNGNNLTRLDLSQNDDLMLINCSNNSLYNLNLSQNSDLTTLYANNNAFFELNLANGNNSNMGTLDITDNPNLSCVNVDANVVGNIPSGWQKDANASYSDACSPCVLTIPDANFKSALLSHNPVIDTDGNGEIECLEAAYFDGTMNVEQMNISNMTGIEKFYSLPLLYCGNNQITELDLSNSKNLVGVYCFNNQLTQLDIANGNNSNMLAMYAIFNASLSCIKIDPNFTPPTDGSWQIDATATYNPNCVYASCMVSFPDANFKNAILNHNPVIDTDGDGDIDCSEASAFTGTLELSNQSISDFSSISAFKNITGLNCSLNNITDLDLSANTSLTTLNCSRTLLTDLDISTYSSITSLNCSINNQLVSLNIANGNNSNFTNFVGTNNSGVSCIKIDAGFTPPTDGSWLKDANTIYDSNCTISVNETATDISSINIFPNPTQGIINIYGDDVIEQVTVYNLQGKEMMVTQNTNEINISDLANGVYILQVQTDHELITQQIVKQ